VSWLSYIFLRSLLHLESYLIVNGTVGAGTEEEMPKIFGYMILMVYA
jgi:hypothetical protein